MPDQPTTTTAKPARLAWKLVVPLIVFALLVGLFVFGLGQDPRTIPSALIGKPAPAIVLADLHTGQQTDLSTPTQGQPWLLNVWASWCSACRLEHPIFLALRQRYPNVRLMGLNYKDTTADAQAWLDELGDPYTVSVSDLEGRVGIEFGVYAVPETFVIDAQGIIQYKHIGPVTAEDMAQTIAPMLELEP